MTQLHRKHISLMHPTPALLLRKQDLARDSETRFIYCIAGDLCGVQFLWIIDIFNFTGLIFADALTHTHYIQCNGVYFVGLIFVVSQSSAKTAKLGSLENL